MKDRAADWAKLAHRGHELANHTVSHPCDLQDQSVVGFRAKENRPPGKLAAERRRDETGP